MLHADDLERLTEVGGLCLTIFEPLQDGDGRPNDPKSRILAAARRASEILGQKGYDENSRAEFIRPILKFAANTNWSGRLGSIVIFRAPGFTKADFWPNTLDPALRLDDGFFILPLAGNWPADGFLAARAQRKSCETLPRKGTGLLGGRSR